MRTIIARTLGNFFGHSALYTIKSIRTMFLRIIYRGTRHECNLCESRLRSWEIYGPARNRNFICPVCSSFGRHRFLWFILTRENLLPTRNQKVLHFAPEFCLERKFINLATSRNYVSGDIIPHSAKLVLDITNIELENNSFDFVICSHILEHIPDDRKALSELFRILKKGGRLAIQVPIGKVSHIYEDPLLVSESDREKYFGQSNHVRIYGPDILQRLKEANYKVQVFDPRDDSMQADFERYAFDISEISAQPYSSESRLYICTKPD